MLPADPAVLGASLALLFCATLVHAALGFGTALVAMPPAVLLLGLERAIPLVGLVVVVTITVQLARRWREVDLHAAWRLVLASALGIPCGLVLLEIAPERLVRALLGAALVGYSLWQLLRPALPLIERNALVYPFGFLAGVLGGAFNTNGPPVVLYGALRQWAPDAFRATLQGYFLPTAVLICAGHAAAGLWTAEVFVLFGLALPGVLAANWLGPRIAARIPAERFTRLLYGVLLVLGVLLFL